MNTEEAEQLPEEALGLRLVRAFLTLPPEQRQHVLQIVEDMSRGPDRHEEGAEAAPR
ncbi:hypothetical protein JQ596_15825 [Bradyrhizobium manausense]|uniref:hypothetical protein n=1 Tax=Bradyrhizobium TaxID=374 RepID=UPI001BA8F1F4|nr:MULTISPECIES: hypothetical protein [Bradyrhizobium]MBR0827014.1 hypothetical protein [Bradyrhizobium manausense]UVO32294.1 hypothetical protein KUF59_17510 [Bradyrhizobium arachidis]